MTDDALLRRIVVDPSIFSGKPITSEVGILFALAGRSFWTVEHKHRNNVLRKHSERLGASA